VSPAQRHKSVVARLGCVICRAFYGKRTPPQVHHIAEGSGLRSPYMTAGLCLEHHQGASGFHTLKEEFLIQYKLPTEYHLLLLVNRFRAEDRI
jgi:hypothetical protein